MGDAGWRVVAIALTATGFACTLGTLAYSVGLFRRRRLSAIPTDQHEARCPKCGGELFTGYGLMGGGCGTYEGCTEDECDYFSKTQDPGEDENERCEIIDASAPGTPGGGRQDDLSKK